WSRDGRFLVLEVLKTGGKTKDDIWLLPLFGDRKAYPFLATEFDEEGASFSPDGRWLSYTSNETGRRELYVVPFPGPGGKWQISTSGALGGIWIRGGREILYGTLDFVATSVEVKAGKSGLEIGAPKTLFQIPGAGPPPAVTPDGERWLFVVYPEASESPRVGLVTNWTAGLTGK
ncbi:MAG TPA: hypothetical protein VGK70_11575, partial [Thermoanaerobaculia bacterium]